MRWLLASAGWIVAASCAVPVVGTGGASAACPEATVEKTATSPQGREIWCEAASGVKHGPYRRTYPGGAPAERSVYDGGARHGEMVSWHATGGLRARGGFVRGQRDGLWREWHVTGKLWLEGSYQAGKRVGLWREHYFNGLQKFHGSYRDGMLEGAWTSYFENGGKRAAGTSVSGRLHGEMTTWDRQGNLSSRRGYDDNRAHGTWSFYAGGKVRSVAQYRNGVRHGRYVQYDASGAVAIDVIYENGEESGSKRTAKERQQ